MIWPSAVMMDCSFSSSICGLLALFSPCISGNVWISCWCETTYMVYQGQYPLMSGPEPCQENLFCRFSLYVDSCCVGREQPASASAPASVSSASVFDRVIFSPLPCAQQELDLPCARLFAAFSRESCPSSFAALSRLFRCRSRSAWTAPCCGETLPGQTA